MLIVGEPAFCAYYELPRPAIAEVGVSNLTEPHSRTPPTDASFRAVVPPERLLF
jgi:hypothetical protein